MAWDNMGCAKIQERSGAGSSKRTESGRIGENYATVLDNWQLKKGAGGLDHRKIGRTWTPLVWPTFIPYPHHGLGGYSKLINGTFVC